MTAPPAPIMSWTRATHSDTHALLDLMREFYLEERLTFDSHRTPLAVAQLLATPALGVVLLLRGEVGALGYLVASFGFSLEFGGRFVLLDELFLRPAARGRGESRRALDILESWASAQGALTTRMEVNRHNDKARAIYLKSGYQSQDRDILTKWCTGV